VIDQKNAPKSIFIIWIVLIICLFPCGSFSQDFPNKPISLWIGYEAGAANDLSARPLAEKAQKELGVPIVVENKPGGGSTVAASLLAVKRPDGYTLALISSTALTSYPILTKVNYDPFKAFTYVISYANYPAGICVNNNSPFKTISDLVEFAKKNPEKLSYSCTGIGAAGVMSVELLAKKNSIKFKRVPFKGASPANTALIGGHVDFTIGHGGHLTYVKQKIFRMLVLTNTDERDPRNPEVPTLKELGYEDVPPAKMMIIAPKGLPGPVLERLASIFIKGAQSNEFRKALDTLELPFSLKSGKQLEEAILYEYESYSRTLKEMGVY
jgi:tripartite-type tricarboxylate transporter receptor subunit TctC